MSSQADLFAPRTRPSRRVDEFAKRDRILDRHAVHRELLIREAEKVALAQCRMYGATAAPRVLAAMKARPDLAALLTQVDPRFIGAVFRRGKGWVRVGYAPEGSHGRPVAVWKRRGE